MFSSENEDEDSEVASPAKTSTMHPAASNTTKYLEADKKEMSCNALTGRCK